MIWVAIIFTAGGWLAIAIGVGTWLRAVDRRQLEWEANQARRERLYARGLLR